MTTSGHEPVAPSPATADDDAVCRADLLERHGRAYGELRLAVAFTAGLDGDDAKRVTARGWDRTPRLAHPEQAAAILRTRGERRNPAIVLAPSGLVGIDVDGREGVAHVRRLVPEGLPATITVETGKELGYHLWFLAPHGARSAFVELGPEGVTAKRNQYLVAPPAVHPSGRVYRFADGRAPWDLELAVLPPGLLERFERAAHGERERRAVSDGPIAEGGRHAHLLGIAGAMRRRGAGEASIRAALLVENLERCLPPQDERLVLELAADVARRYPSGARP